MSTFVRSYLIGSTMRVVSGALAKYIDANFQTASLPVLQQELAFAIAQLQHNNVVELKKFKNSELLLYRGGSHLKLVINDNMDDPKLLAVLDYNLDFPQLSLGGESQDAEPPKDIFISKINL